MNFISQSADPNCFPLEKTADSRNEKEPLHLAGVYRANSFTVWLILYARQNKEMQRLSNEATKQIIKRRWVKICITIDCGK